MHIPRLFHPELAAAKPAAAHPVLESVYLATDPNGRATLTASDGCCLLQVPVDREPEDQDGSLPPALLALASRAAGRHADTFQLTATADTLSYPTPTGRIRQERPITAGAFPAFAGRLPTGRPRARLALDVSLLARLAKALGSPVILLDVFAPDQPFLIHPLSHTQRDCLAVLMPYSSDEAFVETSNPDACDTPAASHPAGLCPALSASV